MMVIAALLVGACFAGCSMSQGSNSLLGNESSKESESYAEHLENNNISVAGNLGTAESVNVDKITSKKEIYSKVRSLVYNDKVVYIELCYINLYDKSGNKVQQEGEVSFQVKMSDTMTNAGGDTYDLYYYDSSDNKITAVDSEVDGNTISFKSDRIGFFVIVNVNNSGKPIVKPSEPVDDPSEETSGGSENKTDHSGEQPTTPAAVKPVVPATTPASQPSVQPTTPAVQHPTTSTPINAATTAGPNITKPTDAVSMPPASGNKEKPNLNINCPKNLTETAINFLLLLLIGEILLSESLQRTQCCIILTMVRNMIEILISLIITVCQGLMLILNREELHLCILPF